MVRIKRPPNRVTDSRLRCRRTSRRSRSAFSMASHRLPFPRACGWVRRACASSAASGLTAVGTSVFTFGGRYVCCRWDHATIFLVPIPYSQKVDPNAARLNLCAADSLCFTSQGVPYVVLTLLTRVFTLKYGVCFHEGKMERSYVLTPGGPALIVLFVCLSYV